jgi:hypothetical protein
MVRTLGFRSCVRCSARRECRCWGRRPIQPSDADDQREADGKDEQVPRVEIKEQQDRRQTQPDERGRTPPAAMGPQRDAGKYEKASRDEMRELARAAVDLRSARSAPGRTRPSPDRTSVPRSRSERARARSKTRSRASEASPLPPTDSPPDIHAIPGSRRSPPRAKSGRLSSSLSSCQRAAQLSTHAARTTVRFLRSSVDDVGASARRAITLKWTAEETADVYGQGRGERDCGALRRRHCV